MNPFCKKIQHTLIVFSACLLIPFTVFANSSVTLLNVSGGTGGATFVEMAGIGGRIATITVRSGSFIDSIQLTYRYGNKPVTGPAHGGRGGRSSSFQLRPGEVIVEMGGRSGKFVDSLYIKTNKGRKERWGGKGGSRSFRFTGSRQSPIIGIWGRSGAFLDAIGAIRASKGGQTIETKNFAIYEKKMGHQGGSCDQCDSAPALQFPDRAAKANELKHWLKTHSTKLENVIKKLSGSSKVFNNYSAGEKKACGFSLYCQVEYRSGAISHVTGAE